jgi:hypothetical protein
VLTLGLARPDRLVSDGQGGLCATLEELALLDHPVQPREWAISITP